MSDASGRRHGKTKQGYLTLAYFLMRCVLSHILLATLAYAKEFVKQIRPQQPKFAHSLSAATHDTARDLHGLLVIAVHTLPNIPMDF